MRMVPGLPEGLSEIVGRMMKKSPDERYATPMQVAQALRPYEGARTGVVNGEAKPRTFPAALGWACAALE